MEHVCVRRHRSNISPPPPKYKPHPTPPRHPPTPINHRKHTHRHPHICLMLHSHPSQPAAPCQVKWSVLASGESCVLSSALLSWAASEGIETEVGSLEGLYTLRDSRGRPDRVAFEGRLVTAAG
ncbi:hypothetical protein ATANTOWER_000666, partial [Ataeniobius toweri]|nr:hypothetical protein [Ataeniobius toweri]